MEHNMKTMPSSIMNKDSDENDEIDGNTNWPQSQKQKSRRFIGY